MQRKPEVLAPAGNWDCVRAAVANGADAIYFGLDQFNARMRADNFTKWKACFEALCGTFGLLSHIDGTTAPDPLTPAWLQEDCCVRYWIYSTVSEAVHNFIMTDNPTARKHWAAIPAHFEANKASRAIFLSQAFMTLSQGDLSVDAYS